MDAFVAGAGTGGTISGVGMFLKGMLPEVRIVVADPQGSGLYNWVRYGVLFDEMEREGTRRREQVDSVIEGIGMNRVTVNFEVGREKVDEAIRVTDEQALGMAKWLVEKDGLFVGSSSAVNCEWSMQKVFCLVGMWAKCDIRYCCREDCEEDGDGEEDRNRTM